MSESLTDQASWEEAVETLRRIENYRGTLVGNIRLSLQASRVKKYFVQSIYKGRAMPDPYEATAAARILIVKDDIIPAKDLAKSLNNLGYEIMGTVSCAEEAVRMIEGSKPDLILMDIKLEGQVDGIEAAGEIRSQFDVPVVYLTGFAEKDVLERAKHTEPYGYLRKTATPLELRSTIETALYKHEADKRVRESEARYRAVIEDQTELICRFLPDFTLTCVNGAFCRYFGKHAEELVGQSFLSLMSVAFHDQVREHFASFSPEHPVSTQEYEVIAPDGKMGLQEWTIRALYDDKGCLIEFQSVGRDITDRKEAEEAMRSSVERYRSIMEASLLGIYVAQDTVFKYVNPEMARLFGFTAQEMEDYLGPPDMVIPEQREMLRNSVLRRHRGEPGKPYEFKGLRKDGSTFDGLVWPTPILYQGRPAAAGTCVDITAQKSLENQLRQAQKMEAVGTLAGGIAHDFNNLLQVVLGYADMLLMDTGREHSHRKGLLTIRQAACDGADLVKGLLTFSRKVGISPRPIDLNQEVQRVGEMLSRTIPKMIELELVLADDLKMAKADPGQMEQILLNLAVNSRDAMPEGGRFIIETANTTLSEDYCKTHVEAEPGEYVLLTVSDTGHGMDKDVVEHIFEPFYSTKETGEGTGLGLATVFGIVKSHKGHIACYSEPGIGTTFKIYLPVMKAKIESDVEMTTEMSVFGTETILLVDDEKEILFLGREMLGRCGYKIITASNGQEALKVYRGKGADISLVILDLIMPKMGGRECLQELLGIDPQVKVLVASGYSANGPTEVAVEAGVKGLISKPYDAKRLLRAVRTVLDES